MKRLLLLALVTAFASTSSVHAEINKEKKAEIERMFQLTGMEKMMDQMMNQMISSMKGQIKDAPDSFWAKFQEKVKTRDLLEQIIPLYDKYYTVEDLKAVNEFYASPAGQKVLATMPQIMQESMKVGQEWGMKISEQAIKEAAEEAGSEKE